MLCQINQLCYKSEYGYWTVTAFYSGLNPGSHFLQTTLTLIKRIVDHPSSKFNRINMPMSYTGGRKGCLIDYKPNNLLHWKMQKNVKAYCTNNPMLNKDNDLNNIAVAFKLMNQSQAIFAKENPKYY